MASAKHLGEQNRIPLLKCFLLASVVTGFEKPSYLVTKIVAKGI